MKKNRHQEKRSPVFAGVLLQLLLLSFPFNASAQKSWTVMVYLNGDNDIWREALEDMNEIEVVGSTGEVDVVVQIDLPVFLDGRPPFTDTRRYHVDRDPAGFNNDIVSTKVWPESGTRELDMGSPQTLSDFAAWAADNYPAFRYALIIWDHGDGWKYHPGHSRRSPLKEISDDYTSGSSMSVSEGELEEALEGVYTHLGRKLDLLGMDACLMGMWEVDVVLGDYADYALHSEETEDADGYDYTALMAFLEANPDAMPDELCASIVDGSIASVGATLSCVDLALIDSVSVGVDDLAARIMDALGAFEAEILLRADQTLRFGGVDEAYFGDIANFAERLMASTILPVPVGESAAALKAAVEGAVVRSAARGYYRDARGLSIYLPVATDPYWYDPAYAEGAGAIWADYLWDEMLCSFSGLVCAPDEYEPDNTTADAKEIGPEDPVQERNLFPLDDMDIARAQVLEGMEYAFYTEEDLDTYMWLYSAEDFRTIARDDDSGTGYNALIEWEADFDGTVYLKVVHWGSTVEGWGPETGPYTLVMTWEGCSMDDVPSCSQEGVCQGTRRLCEGSEWICPYPETYSSLDASCDALDNDCDGLPDDDYEPWVCGVGACSAPSRCAGGAEGCTPLVPPSLTDERCDGIDEDCDGEVDEEAECPECDPAEMPGCLRSGVCDGTLPECSEGAWTCPYPDGYEENEESCDGLDNDCDGLVDEEAACAPGAVRPEGSGLGCSIVEVIE